MIVHSDCQSAVNQIHDFLQNGFAFEPTWLCARHGGLAFRELGAACGVRFTSTAVSKFSWIPAHQLEEVADNLLTETQAVSCGTTVQHILLNRIADRVAKRLASRLAPVCPEILQPGESMLHISDINNGLVQLHSLLPTNADTQVPMTLLVKRQYRKSLMTLTEAQAMALYPQWHWTTPLSKIFMETKDSS